MNYARPKNYPFYNQLEEEQEPLPMYSRAPSNNGGQAAYDASQVAQVANAGADATGAGASIMNALGGGMGAAQLGLGAVGTVANIWSGYQADKTARKALAEENRRYEYQRKRNERAEATANRRATKSEVQGDQANAMNAIDWYASKYVRGAV